MKNKKPLKDIVNINSGYAFRGAILPSSTGLIRVIQTKDMNPREYLTSASGLTSVNVEVTKNSFFIKQGDVLLSSRGAGSHKAIYVDLNKDNIIASSSLYIIRIKNPNIVPQYLALYLNSSEGQNQLSQITSGAYIQNITRSNLENMEIPIPPREEQQHLVSLSENFASQDKLLIRKSQINQKIINDILKKITR